MKVLKSACQYHLLGSSGVFMQSYVIDWYNLDQLVFATTNISNLILKTIIAKTTNVGDAYYLLMLRYPVT